MSPVRKQNEGKSKIQFWQSCLPCRVPDSGSNPVAVSKAFSWNTPTIVDTGLRGMIWAFLGQTLHNTFRSRAGAAGSWHPPELKQVICCHCRALLVNHCNRGDTDGVGLGGPCHGVWWAHNGVRWCPAGGTAEGSFSQGISSPLFTNQEVVLYRLNKMVLNF